MVRHDISIIKNLTDSYYKYKFKCRCYDLYLDAPLNNDNETPPQDLWHPVPKENNSTYDILNLNIEFYNIIRIKKTKDDPYTMKIVYMVAHTR